MGTPNKSSPKKSLVRVAPPPTGYALISIRLPTPVARRVHQIAMKRGVSRAAVLQGLITDSVMS